jgi:hypothetical protein
MLSKVSPTGIQGDLYICGIALESSEKAELFRGKILSSPCCQFVANTAQFYFPSARYDSQALHQEPLFYCTKRHFLRNHCVLKKDGAVEWIRTTTVLLPPAPQAGASASSATTAQR